MNPIRELQRDLRIHKRQRSLSTGESRGRIWEGLWSWWWGQRKVGCLDYIKSQTLFSFPTITNSELSWLLSSDVSITFTSPRSHFYCHNLLMNLPEQISVDVKPCSCKQFQFNYLCLLYVLCIGIWRLKIGLELLLLSCHLKISGQYFSKSCILSTIVFGFTGFFFSSWTPSKFNSSSVWWISCKIFLKVIHRWPLCPLPGDVYPSVKRVKNILSAKSQHLSASQALHFWTKITFN